MGIYVIIEIIEHFYIGKIYIYFPLLQVGFLNTLHIYVNDCVISYTLNFHKKNIIRI